MPGDRELHRFFFGLRRHRQLSGRRGRVELRPFKFSNRRHCYFGDFGGSDEFLPNFLLFEKEVHDSR